MRTTDDTIVQAWTIQPWTVWEQVAAGRPLLVEWKYASGLHVSYDWLREQLLRRIPGYTGRYPWWAYDHRPDLRRLRHMMQSGEVHALLELAVPSERVAILPARAWDSIFSGQYVAADRRESLDWERRRRRAVRDEDQWPLPEPWHSELLASWERIFAADFPRRFRRNPNRPEMGANEIVFECLEESMVRKVTRFVGARKGTRISRDDPAVLGPDSPTMFHRG